ncbi:NADPH-dependent FMN reductase [Denitrobacterium detoxificans]|uniref:Multimeric flavodoxin WrbA n=2 Tax=Denitrobacterium detoxificans TaxID=79604 RepID=A0A172S007_9ACTN|nr:flavodoxin family protein [Denitrobacterium detoxificans]ANE23317.1 NADPH-dependent FMN reductase [Denitrobacterium detoxificans]SEO40088.1 Multimeric flavodoxin WrbA [Denitrobacterium detoxificans]
MNVLMLNGSPRSHSNTALALDEMERVFQEEGISCTIRQVGQMDIRGCIACDTCGKTGKCTFDDIVNELAKEFEKADGLVVGTPVYFGSANPTLVALLDRLFYSTHFDKTMKVGAGISVARRGGTSATYDELNKFFALTGMPIATGQYWNGLHGRAQGEGSQDEEGLQQMRVVARNMAFLIKSIKLGKEAFGLPKVEERVRTNFVR